LAGIISGRRVFPEGKEGVFIICLTKGLFFSAPVHCLFFLIFLNHEMPPAATIEISRFAEKQ
jgi:hypothetical protein